MKWTVLVLLLMTCLETVAALHEPRAVSLVPRRKPISVVALHQLRGGGEINMITPPFDPKDTAMALSLVTLLNSLLLALAPKYTAKNICKFGSQLDETSTQLLRGVGFSNLNSAVTALLALTEATSANMAILYGAISRYAVLVHGLATQRKDSEIKLQQLLPVYVIMGLLLAAMMQGKEWGAKGVGILLLLAGIPMALAPDALIKSLIGIDLKGRDQVKGIFLAQAKADIVNGGIVVGLAWGLSPEKAIGYSCFYWIASVLVTEVFGENYLGRPARTPFVELMIALFSAWNILAE